MKNMNNKNCGQLANIKCWLARLAFGHNSTDGRTDGRTSILAKTRLGKLTTQLIQRAHTLKMQINHVVKLVNLFRCFAFAHSSDSKSRVWELEALLISFRWILWADSLQVSNGPQQKNLVGSSCSSVDETGYNL